jgi:hypothetical protein
LRLARCNGVRLKRLVACTLAVTLLTVAVGVGLVVVVVVAAIVVV